MIACLAVPYFAAAVERREQPALAQAPLVIGGQPWEAAPLFGFSQEAASQGVAPGMPLRQAHLLSPDARFLPSAPLHYADADGEVTDVLADFTHLVAPEALWQPAAGSPAPPAGARALPAGARSLPARYTLDLEALPAPEAVSLVREVGQAVRSHTRLEPAAGLSADPFAAQVAAALTRPGCLRPVPPGGERAFLAARSLDFLPLEREWLRRLRLLGIRTLGQFAALSPAALREQFGAGILPYHRLARGEGAAFVSPPPPSSREQVARRFDPPLVNWLEVHRLLAQMAAELARRLAAAALLGGVLHLRVETEEGAPQQLSLPLRRPSASAARLTQTAQELAQTLSLESGVEGLVLAASHLRPAVVQQLSLFASGAAFAVGEALTSGEALAQPFEASATLAQIMARHPAARFLQPVHLDAAHPLAERRFDLRPL